MLCNKLSTTKQLELLSQYESRGKEMKTKIVMIR